MTKTKTLEIRETATRKLVAMMAIDDQLSNDDVMLEFIKSKPGRYVYIFGYNYDINVDGLTADDGHKDNVVYEVNVGCTNQRGVFFATETEAFRFARSNMLEGFKIMVARHKVVES